MTCLNPNCSCSRNTASEGDDPTPAGGMFERNKALQGAARAAIKDIRAAFATTSMSYTDLKKTVADELLDLEEKL